MSSIVHFYIYFFCLSHIQASGLWCERASRWKGWWAIYRLRWHDKSNFLIKIWMFLIILWSYLPLHVLTVNWLLQFQVWRVDGDELSLLPVNEHTRLYSGDCYIVQYTFPGNGRDETLFYAWLGCRCVTVDVLPIIHRNGCIHHNQINLFL